jgi:hypothetical protein
MLAFFKKRIRFPDYMYHSRKGGHVAAMHAHLNNRLFFKIDIQNFYYSIARMRVTRALRHWGYPGANTFAMWSCVLNPGPGPRHALPIGFVQSPLLASLVLMQSDVARAIERAIAPGVCISVYLDDFVGSHDDQAVLTRAYEDIRDTCVAAGLIPNPTKLVARCANRRDNSIQLRSSQRICIGDGRTAAEVSNFYQSHADVRCRVHGIRCAGCITKYCALTPPKY